MRNSLRQYRSILINRVLLSVVVMLFGIPETVFAGDAVVGIVSENDEGITLELKVSGDQGAEIDGWWIPDMLSCPVIARPGAPGVPMKNVIIAIPPEKETYIKSVRSTTKTIRGVDVRPVPTFDEDGLEPVYDKDEDLYGSEGLFPAEVVKLGGAGIWRGCPVENVIFHPVQVQPAGRTVLMHDSIVVEIGYRRKVQAVKPRRVLGSERGSNIEDPFFGQVVQQAILNSHSAKVQHDSMVGAGQGGELLRQHNANRSGALSPSVEDISSSPFYDSDNWIRIGVDSTSIYTITPGLIQKAGFDPGLIDPAGLRIFYGGGLPLPEDLDEEEPELREIDCYVVDSNSNGAFDGDDLLKFYGEASSRYDFSKGVFHKNPYTTRNCYWLTWGGSFDYPPMRAGEIGYVPESSGSLRVDALRNYRRIEKEELNPRERGYWWVWQEFYLSGEETRCFDFDFPWTGAAKPCSLSVRFYGESSGVHEASMELNGEKLGDVSWNGRFEYTWSGTSSAVKAGTNSLCITAPRKTDPDDLFYFDYFEIFFTTNLVAENGLIAGYIDAATDTAYIDFDGLDPSVAKDAVSGFVVSDSGNLMFHELVPDGEGGGSMMLEPGEGGFVFVSKGNRSPEPAVVESGPGFRLRNNSMQADYIIITTSGLLGAFQPLKDFREERDGLSVEIVTLDEIYDEFSWGLSDPTAIRNFLRFAYFEWDKPAPWFCLLGGDGNYDPMNHAGYSNPRYIVPTHQQNQSGLYEGDCLDDWFFMLEGDDKLMEMVGGRMPAGNAAEAEIMVGKVMTFERDAPPGLWKNTVTIAADDEFTTNSSRESEHTEDSENLARMISSCWSVDRLYEVDFPMNSAGKKPEAEAALRERFDQGRVWINFMGHGNEKVLTHETLFDTDTDVEMLSNDKMQPVFFAGSCSVGRFDELELQCLAEHLVQADGKGAVASIAATKETYASTNYSLASRLIPSLLGCPGNEWYTVGEALYLAKTALGNDTFSQRYVLLGDPALKLPLPGLNADVEISGSESGGFSSLDTITVTGMLLFPESGDTVPAAGTVFYEMRSSGYENQYRLKSTTKYIDYHTEGPMIYRGSADVQNGTFVLRAIVPVDYSTGPCGSVSAYFESEYGETGELRIDTLSFAGEPLSVDAVTFTPEDAGAGGEEPFFGSIWTPASSEFFDESFAAGLIGMPDGSGGVIEPGGWVRIKLERSVGRDEPGEIRIYGIRPEGFEGGTDDYPFIWSLSEDAVVWSNPVKGSGVVKAIPSSTDNIMYLMLSPASPTGVEPDSSGPEIDLWIDGIRYREGIEAGDRSTMTLSLEDPQGISLGGISGNGIVVELYKEDQPLPFTSMDVTGNFSYDHNSFTSGNLEFNIGTIADLNPAMYRLGVSAGDNTGAESYKEFSFRIGEGLKLSQVRVVPNPGAGKVYFTWQNVPGHDLFAKIYIYTVSGRKIKTLEGAPSGRGDISWMQWNGLDESGDVPSNGVYLFRLSVRDLNTDEHDVVTGKFAIMR